MVYMRVEKNNNFSSVELKDFDTKSIIRLYDNKRNMIYITEDGKLVGMIGATEIQKMKSTGEPVINRKGTAIVKSENDKDKAENLFKKHLNWCGIPVVGDGGKIAYEYTYSHEKYYEDLLLTECLKEGINKGEREFRIVISMTTHDERLETVYLALASLMNQTMKADEIVLYLAKGSGDGELKHEEILKKCGVQIVRGVEDIRCHTKYYYSLSEKDNSLVITADDDKLYGDNFIEGLYNRHCEYPDAVICRYGDRIKYEGGKVCTYICWNNYVASSEPESQICIKGHAGVLYPTGEYRKELLKKDVFMDISEYNDDLWITACLQENGIKVFNMGEDNSVEIKGTRKTALGGDKDKTVKRNDEYVRALKKQFSKAFVENI